MAGYKDIYAGSQRFGILRQPKATGAATVWTALGATDDHWADEATATAAFKTLWYDKEVSVPDADIRVEELPYSSQNGNMKETNRKYIETTSVFPKLPFSGVSDIRSTGLHFVAALQKVTEDATTPYLKEMDPVNDPTLDYRNNEGYIYTVAMGNYDSGAVGDGVLLENALLNDFTWEIQKQADGMEKFAKISGTWIGNKLETNQHFTGTWSDLTAPATIFGHNTTGTGDNAWTLNLVVSDTYSSHCWHRFAITVNNNVESRCRGLGGVAANWDLVSPSVTIELDIPMTESSYKIFARYASGTSASLSFGNFANVGTDAAAATGDIQFNVSTSEITANPFTYDNGFQVIRLSMNILYDSTNSRWGGATINDLVQLADGLDQGF